MIVYSLSQPRWFDLAPGLSIPLVRNPCLGETHFLSSVSPELGREWRLALGSWETLHAVARRGNLIAPGALHARAAVIDNFPFFFLRFNNLLMFLWFDFLQFNNL